MSYRRETSWVIALVLAAGSMAVAWGPAEFHPTSGNDDQRGGPIGPQGTPLFINWETPQTHPVEMTPDGNFLLVLNTADNRLQVFDLTGSAPLLAFTVPVGLDPVSVRANSNTEVWVVNQVSDSVTVVNLSTRNVIKSLDTLDEPADVVFAGTPRRAFVSCGTANTVQVFDPANLSTLPTAIAINAEEPRSLAVSADGQTVYAAIFESGNATTAVGGAVGTQAATLAFPPDAVSNVNSPYGGVNPPPNVGVLTLPAPNPAAGTPIKSSMIVKKNSLGQWMDDNNHDWTSMVSGANAALSGRPIGWDMPDRDVAIINANTLGVSYVSTLMNICMSIGVNPATGRVTMVGTDAINEVRYEPIVNGKFVRVKFASVDPLSPATRTITDINSHLTYATPTIAQSERNKSVGDPRTIVWNAAGTKGYVSGMGSNNVVVVGPGGTRVGLSDAINVGEGPTGIALDESRGKMYVLNRFAGTISVISLATETVDAEIPFFDPTPAAIKVGRKHLYDTHKNSGLGQVACASCHVDSKMDRLAWDLGDPSGSLGPIAALNLGMGLPGLSPGTANPAFAEFHPMKGPMTTQTLQDIIGKEPLHWRGDRAGIEAFAGAFTGLQGDDATLTGSEMQEFENFLATIHYPPNPYRNFDNTLPTNMPLPGHKRTGRFGFAGTPLPNGNAVNGLALYRSATRRLDNNAFACVTCHTLPTGAGPDVRLVGATYQPIAPGSNGERHLGVVSADGTSNITTKIPQIRNAYKKVGCDMIGTSSNAGFGFLHDGSVDSLERFIAEPVFRVNNDQEIADLTAFVLCISGSDLPQGSLSSPLEPPGVASLDAHAAVGTQTTLISQATAPAAQINLINSMISIANTNKIGIVAKGRIDGLQRGWSYINGNNWQSDRSTEVRSTTQLLAAAAINSEITFTVVVKGTETRIGIDHDFDGCLDRDFRDGTCGCYADINGDGVLDFFDYLDFVDRFSIGSLAADFNEDGIVDFFDYLDFVDRFSQGC